MESEGKQRESIVIVVSPLNALIRDHVQKLKGFVNVCVLQSTVEDEEQKVTVPKDINKCSLLFGHPEVFLDNKTVAKMLKGEDFQRRVRAIVIDEAHLVLPWCSFRPAYGKIGVLSNLFPEVPDLALTGTATRATKTGTIDSLGLSDPVMVESNPDRANLYYASHVRPDSGDET
ncbi:ATP-dependent DNA helicase RecQ-like [Acropora millepora]|uniref:ATP-dependent DNA helicase RecQ-like n=1 Tax=Acropora millepora TaxID=45264 RepID=UPI001CF38D64|nr:ATP-dependent DNA helicase RecQ-like [Acropora millepora]